MTLLLVPAWQLPTVTTATSPGVTSRDTMVCSRTMIMAASTTGSTVFCGAAPWPPRPYTVILMLSAAAMNGPERVRTVPAMPDSRCWASATSGTGRRLNRPSSTISWAPSPVSSAGWNSVIRVPFHRSRWSAMSVAMPVMAAMCRSWPQA